MSYSEGKDGAVISEEENAIILCEFLSCDAYTSLCNFKEEGWNQFGDSHITHGMAFWCPDHSNLIAVAESDKLWEAEILRERLNRLNSGNENCTPYRTGEKS